MASDSQILALSTMFTEDVFAFYGGAARFGPAVQVQTGRIFVVLLTVVAYSIAMTAPQSIFDIASQYAFAGYAALSPLLDRGAVLEEAARSGARSRSRSGRPRRWPASRCCSRRCRRRRRARAVTVWAVGGVDVITRIAAGTTVFGFLPVVPMTI